MTRPELELIAETAVRIPPHGVVVEIGSFAGRSSVHWAANSHPSVRIFCIDPFDYILDDYSFEHIQGDPSDVRDRPCGEIFAEHTSRWANRIVPLAQRSPPGEWNTPADVVFIDGDHTADGVRSDLEFWRGCLKPRGRLLGHDWDDPRVRQAVESFGGRDDLAVRCHDGTCIWEIERVSSGAGRGSRSGRPRTR